MKMNKLAGVGLGVMAMAAVAGAQTNGPTGLSARIGVFSPTSSFARDLGKTWFGLGVDYKLNNIALTQAATGMPSYLGLSLDYYSHGSNSNIPVVLNYNVRSGQFVYFAGAGVDFYNIDDLSDSGTGLDLQAGVTYEFGAAGTASLPLFLQAKYFYSAKEELRGFGIYAGVRF